MSSSLRKRTTKPKKLETTGRLATDGSVKSITYSWLTNSSNATSLPGLLFPGAISNAYLLYKLATISSTASPHALIPAQILALVSGFRCIFPNRYNDCVVWRDSFLSSIFLTRFMCTISEMVYIYQFSWFLREVSAQAGVVCDVINYSAWAMVIFCALGQTFCWISIIYRTNGYFWHEEFCWAVLMGINMVISIYLFVSGEVHEKVANGEISESIVTGLKISLWFSLFYMPFQCLFHVPMLKDPTPELDTSFQNTVFGLKKAVFYRQKTNETRAWGGVVGALWMVGYFVAMPCWLSFTAFTFSE